MTWFKDFYFCISKNFGEERLKVVKNYLDSFLWKVMLADYHAEEALKILSSSIPENSKHPQFETVKQIILVASGADESKEIKIAWFKSEANIIAFAQSLHSSCDILAKAIYQGLDLGNNLNKKIEFKYQNLFSIRDGMQSSNYAQNVTESIDQFLKSENFLYLHTYVNKTKHQSLISVRPRVSFEHNKHGLIISEFTGETDTKFKWASKWADEFLVEDFNHIKSQFENIGEELVNFQKTA